MTYCSTGPALCVPERLVHISDPSLLPDDMMFVRYEAPDDLKVDEVLLDSWPKRWDTLGGLTRRLGNDWLDGVSFFASRRSSCRLRTPATITS